MKKQIALLLSLMLLCTVFTAIGVQASSLVIYDFEDFAGNDETLSVLPPKNDVGNWDFTNRSSGSDGVNGVTSAKTGKGTSAELISTSTSSYLSLRFTLKNEIADTVDIKASMMPLDFNANRYIVLRQKSTTDNLNAMIIDNKGKVSAFGSSTGYTVEPKKWYDIHIIYNVINGYYYFEISTSDSGVVKDGYFADYKKYANIHKVLFSYWSGFTAGTTAHTYFDDIGINEVAPYYEEYFEEYNFENFEGSANGTTAPAGLNLSGTNANVNGVFASDDVLALQTGNTGTLGLYKSFGEALNGKFVFKTIITPVSGDKTTAFKIGGDEVLKFTADKKITVGGEDIGNYTQGTEYEVLAAVDTKTLKCDIKVTGGGDEVSGVTALSEAPVSAGIYQTGAGKTLCDEFDIYSGNGMYITSSEPALYSHNVVPQDVMVRFTNPIKSVENVLLDGESQNFDITDRNEIKIYCGGSMEFGKDYSVKISLTDVLGESVEREAIYSTPAPYELGMLSLDKVGKNAVASISGVAHDGKEYKYDLVLVEYSSDTMQMTGATHSKFTLSKNTETYTALLPARDGYIYEAYLWDDISSMNPLAAAVSMGESTLEPEDIGGNGFSENMDSGIISACLQGITGGHKTFMMLYPGKTLSDVAEAEDITEVIAFIKQFDNAENDSFAFSLNPKRGGNYGMVLNTAGDAVFTPEVFSYIASGDIKEAFEQINGNDVDLASAVNSYNEVLKVDDTELKNMQAGALAVLNTRVESARDGLENGKFASFEQFASVYYKALGETLISNASGYEDVKAAVEKYYSYIGCDKFALYDTFKTLSDAGKKAIYEVIAKEKPQNTEDTESIFNKSTVLNCVRYAKSQIEIGSLLVGNNDNYLHFDLKDYNSLTNKVPVHTALMGKSYASIAELESALNKAVKAEKERESDTTPTPVKPGGGSTGISNVTISSPAATGKTQPAFGDLAGFEWAQEAIGFLNEKNILNGKGNNSFAPSDNITREEFAKIVVLAFSELKQGNTLPFGDVDSSAWYAQYIASAYGAGLIQGIGDGAFGVGRNITRQDMAVMLCRAAEKANIKLPVAQVGLGDANDIADYAQDAVKKLYASGIVSGRENGNFDPGAFASRAEAAKMVYGLMAKGGMTK